MRACKQNPRAVSIDSTLPDLLFVLFFFRASTGTCWCSEEVWTGAEQQSAEFERTGIVGRSLGTFQLKGVPDMDLVQCRCVYGGVERICYLT